MLKPTNIVDKGEVVTFKSGKRMSKWYADSGKTSPKEREKIMKNALTYYNKNKHDPAYRKKATARFQRWRYLNHEKHNNFMREYMRKRSFRLYHERREAGICTRCGKNSTPMADCDECKSKRRFR